MIIKNTIAALIPLALMAGAVFAQGEEEKVSPAKLMLELEEALPRKAPETGQPVAFAHSVKRGGFRPDFESLRLPPP